MRKADNFFVIREKFAKKLQKKYFFLHYNNYN